jgi:hypothetical protein
MPRTPENSSSARVSSQTLFVTTLPSAVYKKEAKLFSLANGPESVEDPNLRMCAPAHQEATMRFLAFIYQSIHEARGANLFASTCQSSECLGACLYCDVACADKFCAFAPGWIGEVDDNVVSRHVVDKIPQKHVCEHLRRVVVLLGIEFLRNCQPKR